MSPGFNWQPPIHSLRMPVSKNSCRMHCTHLLMAQFLTPLHRTKQFLLRIGHKATSNCLTSLSETICKRMPVADAQLALTYRDSSYKESHKQPLRIAVRFAAIALIALSLLSQEHMALGQSIGVNRGAVSGRVTCRDTETPCRFAVVTLELASSLRAKTRTLVVQNSDSAVDTSFSYTTRTNMDGRFVIRNIPAGTYYIEAHMPGYISPYDIASTIFPANMPGLTKKAINASLTQVVVQAGQSTSIGLSLERGATIQGNITYDDGGFGINLPITLFRQNSQDRWTQYHNTSGNSILSFIGIHDRTNSRGHFVIPGLPAGVYTIEVSLPKFNASPGSIGQDTTMALSDQSGQSLHVFFGQSFLLNQAEEITVQQGEIRNGIDITVPTQGLYTISGTVSSLETGRPITGGSINLLTSNASTVLSSAEIQGDGTFTIKDVPAGLYQIVANGLHLTAAQHSDQQFSKIVQAIEVDGDILDLRLQAKNTAH